MKYVIKRKKDGKYWCGTIWVKDINRARVIFTEDSAREICFPHSETIVSVRVRIEEVSHGK